MGERVVRIPALGSNDGDESSNNIGILEQESLIDGSNSQFTSALISSGFESVLNRLVSVFLFLFVLIIGFI